jgi:hypothetical protein
MGTELSNPSDLRAALTRNPRQFAFAFTEKLLVFALGRTADFNDMPTIRSIVNAAGNDGYRFSSNRAGNRDQRAVPVCAGAGRGAASHVRGCN